MGIQLVGCMTISFSAISTLANCSALSPLSRQRSTRFCHSSRLVFRCTASSVLCPYARATRPVCDAPDRTDTEKLDVLPQRHPRRGAAASFSIIASCRLHSLDPQQYLDEILRVLPYWPKERHLELAPKYWLATRAKLDPIELDAPLCSFTIPAA
jgi:hypothetical protein